MISPVFEPENYISKQWNCIKQNDDADDRLTYYLRFLHI